MNFFLEGDEVPDHASKKIVFNLNQEKTFDITDANISRL